MDIIVVSILQVSDFENDLGYVGVRATSGLSISSIYLPALPVQPVSLFYCHVFPSLMASVNLSATGGVRMWMEWEEKKTPRLQGRLLFLKADSPAPCHSLAFATWVLAECPSRRKLLYETGSSTKGIDFLKLFKWLMV